MLVTLAAHGMLTLSAERRVHLHAALNYAGPDVASPTGRTTAIDSGNIATVQILVNQVNDPPLTDGRMRSPPC